MGFEQFGEVGGAASRKKANGSDVLELGDECGGEGGDALSLVGEEGGIGMSK